MSQLTKRASGDRGMEAPDTAAHAVCFAPSDTPDIAFSESPGNSVVVENGAHIARGTGKRIQPKTKVKAVVRHPARNGDLAA